MDFLVFGKIINEGMKMVKKYLKCLSKDFPKPGSKTSFGGQVYSVIREKTLEFPTSIILEGICPVCFQDFTEIYSFRSEGNPRRRCKNCARKSRIGGLKE